MIETISALSSDASSLSRKYSKGLPRYCRFVLEHTENGAPEIIIPDSRGGWGRAVEDLVVPQRLG